MKPCLALILAVVLAGSASAQLMSAEKIEGAFGITLGGPFTGILDGEKPARDGALVAGFRPKDAYPGFGIFYALLTPKTKLVFAVVAVGEIRSDPAFAALVSSLESKYGNFKDPVTDSKWLVWRRRHGNRIITLKRADNGVVDLEYRDESFTDQVAREASSEAPAP